VVARLLVAAVLGMVIGIDREFRDISAGLRTHMLVAIAAAVFTLVTFELLEQARAEGISNVDPIRVVEAVTAGVAFLAAGSIIQARGRVHGLTTGAGLWLAGAVGTACGTGAYAIAVIAAVLGFLVVSVLRRVEKKLPKSRERGDPGGAEE
jgi:putative Mg2+ transporter-C (MgtC) family protein